MTSAFRFRASTVSGDEVRGVLRAISPGAAIDELRRQSLVPVEVEAETNVERNRGARGLIVGRGVGGAEQGRAVAMRTIATMIGGGATIDRALAFAAEHATNPEISRSVSAIRTAVCEGSSLSAALRQEESVFGSLAAAVARAGEESGTLDDGLSQLAEHLDRARELRATFRQALWYPALMGIVAGVGVTVLLMFVVPRFVQMLGET
ncbi:MAG: type II secretion system F family protein, partial [Gemmatimonadaceae bacterium]